MQIGGTGAFLTIQISKWASGYRKKCVLYSSASKWPWCHLLLHTKKNPACTSHKAGPRYAEDCRYLMGSEFGFHCCLPVLCKGTLPLLCFLLCLLYPKPSCCYEPHAMNSCCNKWVTKGSNRCSSLPPAGEKQTWPGAGILLVCNTMVGKYFYLMRIPNKLLRTVSRQDQPQPLLSPMLTSLHSPGSKGFFANQPIKP